MTRLSSNVILLFTLQFIIIANISIAQDKPRNDKPIRKDQNQKGKNKSDQKQNVDFSNISLKDNLILTRPTSNSITASIITDKGNEVYIEYSTQKGIYSNKSQLYKSDGNPIEIDLKNLNENTRYYYKLNVSSKENTTANPECSFHTKRNVNDSFEFTITADSHLDQNTDLSTYELTLKNASKDSADFHIDLGDTFMTDKYRENYKDAQMQYYAQRYYFGLLCSSSALFLVLGNHDGESGQQFKGNEDNMTVWSNQTRKRLFPNPFPDNFYSGNQSKENFVGQPQDYYAWEWGNSLFVVLDPFWYTPRSGSDNPWDRTLGKTQYDWLKSTLESSKSKYKFIFIHNLVGGVDLKGKGRGGAEAADLFEWGGKNLDGTFGFETHRLGWEQPIHDLLVKHKVNIVFHGHDHLFAKQEKDGIIYQCIPQPGSKERGNVKQAEEYSYLNGKIMNGAGYIRVSISPNQAKIDYLQTNTSSRSKEVVYSYTLN